MTKEKGIEILNNFIVILQQDSENEMIKEAQNMLLTTLDNLRNAVLKAENDILTSL